MNIRRRRPFIRALLLLALAGLVIAISAFLPIRDNFRPDRFQRIIVDAGLMGPAFLSILCAVGTCLFVPGTVFVAVGAAIFGPLLGFACVWPGTLAGAAISYFAARKLGRDMVYSLIEGRLEKYDEFVERNGFKAILVLRLMFVPLAAMNYGAGLTKVRFRDYFLATALGEAATILIITLFIGEVRQVWISGDGSKLFSAGMVVSLGLLLGLAVIAKRLRRKYIGRPKVQQ